MKLKTLLKATALVFMTSISTYSFADYPDKRVNFVIPFPPGGPTDVSGRLLSEALSKELNQTFVVENRSGASGSIGMSYVIRSKADGYTVGALAAPNLVAPFMLDKAPYDLTTDIKPVGMAYVTPLVVLVNPKYHPEIKDMASLFDAIHDDSKGFNYTTSGIGSTAHLAMEIIAKKNDLDIFHIPYQGSAPGINALLAGDVGMMYSDLVAALPQIKSGDLKAIAVNTQERLDEIDEVPTLVEQDIDAAKAESWGGLVLPKETPDDVVNTLSKALEKVLKDDELQDKMKRVGAYSQYEDPETLKEIIKRDSQIWSDTIKEFDIKK